MTAHEQTKTLTVVEDLASDDRRLRLMAGDIDISRYFSTIIVYGPDKLTDRKSRLELTSLDVQYEMILTEQKEEPTP